MNFRAAIVGCGMIAGRFEDFNTSPTYSHAKAFLQNSAFGDIGFYDRHQERAENLALKAKGKAFDSIEKLLFMYEMATNLGAQCVGARRCSLSDLQYLSSAHPMKLS